MRATTSFPDPGGPEIRIRLLVLPAFLQSNSKLKQFLKNLSIWAIIVIIIMTLIYIIN